MSDVFFGGGESFNRGDRVQQVGLVGLGQLSEHVYVLSSDNGELELSKSPDGPPLTDKDQAPRHYPSRAFRKVTW
jgi:hypothetical protein